MYFFKALNPQNEHMNKFGIKNTAEAFSFRIISIAAKESFNFYCFKIPLTKILVYSKQHLCVELLLDITNSGVGVWIASSITIPSKVRLQVDFHCF